MSVYQRVNINMTNHFWIPCSDQTSSENIWRDRSKKWGSTGKRSEDWRQWLILVGGIPTPLKNDGVRQMGLLFPIYGKSSKPCSKPPTSYTPWSTMNNPQGIVRWVSHINGPWIGGCPIATFDDQVGRKVVVWYARNTATLGKTARFRTTWLIMGPWGPWWATGGQKNWWKSLRSLTQPLSLHVTWQLGWLQDN